MAKPNDPASRYAQRKQEPQTEQIQEQEEEVQKGANEHDNRLEAQNTLGNQALLNQMMTAANPAGDDGGGAAGLALRKAGQEADKDYGGDDDVDDDLPLTLEDLVRNWSPPTERSEDRPSWLEPMPSDELPPEDEAYLAAIRPDGPQPVRGGFTVDSQLQPSRSVVAAGMMDWARAVAPWCASSVLDRVLAHSFAPGLSLLHDLEGRVLFHRARMGAIGSLLLQRGPVLREHPSTANLAFIAFCLELQGHRRHAEMVRIDPGVKGKTMPKTPDVFARSFSARPGRSEPRPLPPEAMERLEPVLDLLLDLEDPAVYLPAMCAPSSEDEDDPLGLDAVLIQFTGGLSDDPAALYYSATQAAERLAAATARTRIHVAAAAVALAQVARLWSAGPPLEALERMARTLDQETDRNLRLLVEIARATRSRSVPPRGLKMGLTRAARALRAAHAMCKELLAEIVGGLLPAMPSLPPREEPLPTPLEEAWADGEPRRALPWLERLPPTPEHRLATLLVQLEAGLAATKAGEAFLEIAATCDDELLRDLIAVYAGPCLLLAENWDGALELALQQMERALQRRNGAMLADATLLGIEALRGRGEPDAAEALRRDGGRKAWSIGAPGAITLLARYTPPPPLED